MPGLEIERLSMRFGGLLALDQVTFDVGEKEIVGLIGPNGAGKTTVLNLVSRFYEPVDGRIRFDGKDVLAHKAHDVVRLGIARTFQNVELFRSLTVLDNLLVGQHARTHAGLAAAAFALPRARAEERWLREQAMSVLELLGMEDLAHVPAASLPFGLQKMVELARALVSQPRLLLLDEPAAGLNPAESRALGGLLRRVRDQFSCAMLVVEHEMTLVMDLSERLVVLDFGQVIAQGAPEAVAEDPAVIEAYLGSPMRASEGLMDRIRSA